MKRFLWIALLLCPSLAFGTDFYVDADYAGAIRNGAAATPWQNLGDTVTNNPWAAINTALATAAVTVYFSAREAATDTSDQCCEVTLNRTDLSTNRLTLDGLTKWNTNDTTPSWMDYGGSPSRDTPKSKLINQGSGWAIGWGENPIIPAMDYVTIRGFETTGDHGRFRLEGGGSHFIVEYNYVHDVTGGGPGMQFNAGGYAYSAGPTSINPSGVCTLRISHLSDDVIFRYNHITDTADENLYFGGNGEDGSGHGFDCPGHSNIQFLGNTLSNPGAFGVGEGDCFDLKNGVRNITYSGNIVGPCWRNGIPLLGAAVSFQPQTVLVEGNLVHDTNTLGGTAGIAPIVTWTTVPSGVTIRNNILYNAGISAVDGAINTDGDGAKYNINIYNNTVDGGVIYGKYINTGSFYNNIILAGGFSPVIDYSQVSSFTDNYNATYTGGGPSRGGNSIALSSGQAAALFVDEPGRDYRLANNTVAAYNAGTNTGCPAADYYGIPRPQAVICDIGAAEFGDAPFLDFTTDPTNTASGAAISAVVVTVKNADGSTDTGSTASITITVNGCGTVLGGTTSGNAVAGVKSFAAIVPTGAGTSCILTAAASMFTSATSASFNVTVPPSMTGGGLPMTFAPAQFLTSTGKGPAAAYRICTYAAGTTKILPTYATVADALAGTNPITPPRILDDAGRIALFLGDAAYKFVLYTDNGKGNTCNGVKVGSAIWTEDNIRTSLSIVTLTTLTATTVNASTADVGTLAATNLVSTNIVDPLLVTGRVVVAGTAGKLGGDTDLTFSGSTLTATKVVASTATTAGTVTDSALTSGRVPIASTAGLIADDADLTFSGDTLTVAHLKTTEVSRTSADLTLKTTTSGNITLTPVAAATAATKVNSRFEQALGTTIVSSACSNGDCVIPGNGNFFLVSGTTTIDGFSTAGIQAGTEVILKTLASITLTNSGTVADGFAPMKLVAGADVSMTSNDLIRLLYDGAQWNQLAPVLVK